MLGTTAAEPYYDEQGNLVAVFSAQFPLPAITDFLKTLKVSSTGQVFLLDRAGSLIATSTAENSIIEVKGEKKMLKAVDSKNLLTNRTVKYLQQHFGNLSQVKQSQDLSFDLDGKHQDVLVQPYANGKGLDILVVVVVPEADFMEQINANTRITILLCLMALGVAIVFGILTARIITTPVLRLIQASKELAAGNLDKRIDTKDLIEIGEIDTMICGNILALKKSLMTSHCWF